MSSQWPDLKVKKLFPDSKLPVRANPTDSGVDVFAYRFERWIGSDGNVVTTEMTCDTSDTPVGDLPRGTLFKDLKSIQMPDGSRLLVHCGISVAIPEGYEVQVRPRSGLALKNGLTVLNTPGTIDSSYRGFVGVILINLSGTLQKISIGDKIAQLVVAPVCLSTVVEVDDLDETSRGVGGFGSTGNT